MLQTDSGVIINQTEPNQTSQLPLPPGSLCAGGGEAAPHRSARVRGQRMGRVPTVRPADPGTRPDGGTAAALRFPFPQKGPSIHVAFLSFSKHY